jgi:hypothetical protein
MTSDAIDGHERTRTICERIDRENDLIAQRTTWMMASQTFLLSAYGVCVVGTNNEELNPHAGSLELLIAILPWAAVASLLLLYVTVASGIFAMARLRRSLRLDDEWYRLLVHGDLLPRVAGLAAPLLLPAVFLVTWGFIIRFR